MTLNSLPNENVFFPSNQGSVVLAGANLSPNSSNQCRSLLINKVYHADAFVGGTIIQDELCLVCLLVLDTTRGRRKNVYAYK